MTRRQETMRRPQQGLALITAVLVVAIVATVATTLALGEQVWLRQTQNVADRAQAESLRQGALGYAAILLARDGKANQTDHLGELWAQPLPPLPVENGMIAFQVSDAQSRFNLNNLFNNGERSPNDIAMFQRLLASQSLDPGLAEALLKWIDPASNVRTGGAVDTEYLNLPQPYRAANRPLTSVDELRLVKGFNAAAVEKLRPYVVALSGHTTVNVNTAAAPVLAALFPNTPDAALFKPFIDSRAGAPLTQASQITQLLPPGTPPPQAGLYDVKTGYFLVTIDIRYGRLQRKTEALIERLPGKPATVLWHQLPPLQIKLSPDEKT